MQTILSVLICESNVLLISQQTTWAFKLMYSNGLLVYPVILFHLTLMCDHIDAAISQWASSSPAAAAAAAASYNVCHSDWGLSQCCRGDNYAFFTISFLHLLTLFSLLSWLMFQPFYNIIIGFYLILSCLHSIL